MAIQASTTINRPIQAVFDCMTNIAFLQQLTAAFSARADALPPELYQASEGVMGVGTKFIQSNASVSHSVETTIEVIEYNPPMVFALEVTRGSDVSVVKWVFKSASAGTMVTLMLRPKRQNWLVKVVERIVAIVAPHSRTVPAQYTQGLQKFIEDHC